MVKYWGKESVARNVPATASVAVTLGGLDTVTEIHAGDPGSRDRVTVGGAEQDPGRFSPFFDEARRLFRFQGSFSASSDNSFPSSAGLASSSSGFAALALGCARLAGLPDGEESLALASEAARVGSASAARAVYGGFTLLPAGALRAETLHDAGWWPEFRILVAVTSSAAKSAATRAAMESTRLTSPYYGAWVEDSRAVAREALSALHGKDLERLGELARLSYMRMHASALAADPPVVYWLPASLAVIGACAELRARGIQAWETMDAGPQVKIICLDNDMAAISSALRERLPDLGLIESRPGKAPDLTDIPCDPDHAETSSPPQRQAAVR
jgi:diphosphomevalonate decarboxylase